jgi:hypothetical protein
VHYFPRSDNLSLGVEVDCNLKFDLHISNIVARAFSCVGLIYRGFTTRNIDILRKAFITYVRPIMDYASSVWNPCLWKHINALEKVQRKFSKRIPKLRHLPYDERLAVLNLDTLELRRLKADIILYFKIINNKTPWSPDQYFNMFVPARETRFTADIHRFHISAPECGVMVYENDFFQRCISCWNLLPADVVHSNSVLSFKSKLAQVDFSKFLKYKFKT